MKTVINGRTVELFDKKDIGCLFTQKVNELLAQGFVFHLGENARGHQGEEMKVCLTNDGGKTLYLVFIDVKYLEHFYNSLRVVINKYENAGRRTLWLNEGERIYEKMFYCINDYYRHSENPVFTDDESVYEAIYKIGEGRWEARRVIERKTLPDSANDAGYRLLRKRRGYGKIARKDVVSVERYNGHFCVNLVGNRSVAF